MTAVIKSIGQERKCPPHYIDRLEVIEWCRDVLYISYKSRDVVTIYFYENDKAVYMLSGENRRVYDQLMQARVRDWEVKE